MQFNKQSDKLLKLPIFTCSMLAVNSTTILKICNLIYNIYQLLWLQYSTVLYKERKTFFKNEKKSRDAAAKKYRYKRSRDK